MNENNVVNNQMSTLNSDNVGFESLGNGNNELTSKKPKQRNVGVLVAVLIILVLAFIGVFLLHQFAGSKNAFKTFIDNGFNYLEGNVSESKNMKGTLSLKVGGSSDDEDANSLLSILDKVDLNIDYGIDYDNKIIDMDIKSNYSDSKLINAIVYSESGNGYIYLEDLYDKYLSMEIEDYDSYFDGLDNVKDYEVVVKSIHKSLDNALKDEYFTKTKEELNGKKVDKTTIVLDNETYQDIKNDFLSSLLGDNDFIKSVAKVSEKEEDEVKELLNEYLEEDEKIENIEFSIYTDKLKFVKFEMIGNGGNITVTKEDDIYNYSINTEDEVYKGTVTIKKDNDSSVLEVSFSNEGNEIRVKLTSSVKNDGKIEKRDVTGSVKIDELTDEDEELITSKLTEQEGVKNLISDISGLFDTDLDDSIGELDDNMGI